MPTLLQNKYVRFTGLATVLLIAIFIILFVLSTFSNSPTFGTSTNNQGFAEYGYDEVEISDQGLAYRADALSAESFYAPEYIPPATPSEYTADLEQYETTDYNIHARTKQFTEFCTSIENLKADPAIHFKTLNSSTNNCNATFYAATEKTTTILNTLQSFSGVEVSRNTRSVTRHRAQLQSQTAILQQQLSSIQRSLTAAETQFDEIAEFARQSKDAATLSQAISQKLNLIDNLTSRKINLTSQLNRLHQQAADLTERLDVVQFSVNINRSHPIYPNQESQKWESAWEELQETFTDTLIGLTAFFGIFILWSIRIAVYLLVVMVVIRILWKFIKLLWQKDTSKNSLLTKENNNQN